MHEHISIPVDKYLNLSAYLLPECRDLSAYLLAECRNTVRAPVMKLIPASATLESYSEQFIETISDIVGNACEKFYSNKLMEKC